MLLCFSCERLHTFPYISFITRNHGSCDYCGSYGHWVEFPSVYDKKIIINNDKIFNRRGYRMDYATDCMGNEILIGDLVAWPFLESYSSTVTTQIAKVLKVEKSKAYKPKYPFYLRVEMLNRNENTGKFESKYAHNEYLSETTIRKLSNVAVLNVANEVDITRRGTQVG